MKNHRIEKSLFTLRDPAPLKDRVDLISIMAPLEVVANDDKQ